MTENKKRSINNITIVYSDGTTAYKEFQPDDEVTVTAEIKKKEVVKWL